MTAGGRGRYLPFARNSEVLQNDLTENYDPIGRLDARIRRSEQVWWRAIVESGGSGSGIRECGCMVEGELLTLSTVAWGLKSCRVVG